MTTQDWVLSICQWGFLLALVPSLRSEHKPAVGTSFMTGSLLSVMSFTFLSLDLWMSALSTALVALGWYWLCAQKIMRP